MPDDLRRYPTGALISDSHNYATKGIPALTAAQGMQCSWQAQGSNTIYMHDMQRGRWAQ